ncbi:hypothetical protein Hypma_013940 [Hypsizygus marmoreus]|uniref:Uncharacterized protein n=1 Tax=Hypsizygus marmoreus TaxID=39966 RepID=A0A369KG16_HYPMA|nr:hypothetical protein Hypma_013940 [Hypsizygus marmoreus]
MFTTHRNGRTSGDDAFLQLQTMSTAITTDRENLVVASDFEKLRSLDITLEDSVGVECILDSGSQIVARERRYGNDSAHQSIGPHHDNGIGKRNHRQYHGSHSIGGHEFFVQCQVVKDAGYDMPWGAVLHPTESVTKDFQRR